MEYKCLHSPWITDNVIYAPSLGIGDFFFIKDKTVTILGFLGHIFLSQLPDSVLVS